jgi:hypothetical protein
VSLLVFEYAAFGTRIPTAEILRANKVQSVGFTLADKQAGPFRRIDWRNR